MAVAKKKIAKAKTAEVVVKLTPMNIRTAEVTVESISPMVQHRWSEKAKEQLRQKHAGKKTKNREVRDIEAEAKAATYLTSDGRYGVPATAIKKAMITAAHKDIGIEKTLVRKALFIEAPDDLILPIECDDPVLREDPVKVGVSGTDLRYRPEFRKWSLTFTVQYDADLMQLEDLTRLLDRAGFGVGIGEMRPEKDGEYGRFRVRTS